MSAGEQYPRPWARDRGKLVAQKYGPETLRSLLEELREQEDREGKS